jgi:hypothetical protein
MTCGLGPCTVCLQRQCEGWKVQLLVLLVLAVLLTTGTGTATDATAGSGRSYRDLPMFPAGLFSRSEISGSADANAQSGQSGHNTKTQLIPKNLWLAVKNTTDVLQWENVIDMRKKNPDWKIYVWDNAQKDKFMSDNFMGSRVLWAYENINPAVGGAARADIWRYAVLLLVGGVCK